MHNMSFLLKLNEVNLMIFKVIANRYKKMGIDVTPVHSRIIMFLYNSQCIICQKDIEKYISCNKSTMSAVLHTMEKNNLIVRVGAENDLRKKNITLTDKSLEIARILEEDKYKIEKILETNINEYEYDVFCNVLNKIKNNLERI